MQHEQRQRHVGPAPARSARPHPGAPPRARRSSCARPAGPRDRPRARADRWTSPRGRDPPRAAAAGARRGSGARSGSGCCPPEARARRPTARRRTTLGDRSRANVATTSPPMLCPIRNSGMLGRVGADLLQHDREIVEVLVESIHVAAPARGSAVPAMIVARGRRSRAARATAPRARSGRCARRSRARREPRRARARESSPRRNSTASAAPRADSS